jgi:hypothetical protein
LNRLVAGQDAGSHEPTASASNLEPGAGQKMTKDTWIESRIAAIFKQVHRMPERCPTARRLEALGES